MDNNLFEGLENLGFDDVKNIDLYSKKEEELEKAKVQMEKEAATQKSHLYDKEITCPVCNHTSNVKAVKTSSYRIGKKHSDFYTEYLLINPYFYDVWVCNLCGYSAMKTDFEKIKSRQIEQIQSKLSIKWHGRNYPDIYDVDIAIERFKLALLNSVIMEVSNSRKAMNCLKLAWMYRIKEDDDKEKSFLSQALEGFKNAYYGESFPIYGMDRYTIIYLIGELSRRLGDFENAMVWFSQVITAPNISGKIKEMAKDQRDLIKISLQEEASVDSINIADQSNEEEKKSGLLSKFFK